MVDAVDLQTFIRNLEREFDDLGPRTLDTNTRFLDLPHWTSLQALLIAVGFERDYGVTLSADEFRAAVTIADLHRMVLTKMGR
jgi:acyl carrier protein